MITTKRQTCQPGLKTDALLLFVVAINLILKAHGQTQQHEPISRNLPENITATTNIVYATYEDRSLRLDFYELSDRDKTPVPVIVVMRGGGWVAGDKEGFAPIAAALAERGLAAACIEFRGSGEAIFPAAIEDMKAAVGWLKANANRYCLNPDAIGAIGGSSGAHLAAYLALTDNGKRSVAAVVGLATPANLELRPETEYIERFLGTSYQSNPDLWKSASPISHVSAASPPLLLIHSESDKVVPFEDSLELAERYGKAGAPIELVLIPNAPHDFWNYKQWFGETMDRSATFFWRRFEKPE